MCCSCIPLTYFLMQKAVTIFIILWYYIKASKSSKGRLSGLREKKRKTEKRQICGRYALNPSLFSHCSSFSSFCNLLMLYHFSGDSTCHVGILTCLLCHLHLQNLSNMAIYIEKTCMSTKAVPSQRLIMVFASSYKLFPRFSNPNPSNRFLD